MAIIERTERDYKIMYEAYIKAYNKSAKFAKSRGATPRFDALTYAEFKVDYQTARSESTKSGLDIVKDLAKSSVYSVSSKQAKSLAEAHIKEFGGNMSIQLQNQYRLGGGNALLTKLSLRRLELKDDGYTSYAINKIISQEFFGSN